MFGQAVFLREELKDRIQSIINESISVMGFKEIKSFQDAVKAIHSLKAKPNYTVLGHRIRAIPESYYSHLLLYGYDGIRFVLTAKGCSLNSLDTGFRLQVLNM